jgi:DNA-binding XRE family transcriptional regulator
MQVDETLLYNLIGTNIKQQRLQVDMTQTQLADAVGVLRTSITDIEAGRQKPPLHLLYNLCLALGIEVATVLPTNAAVSQTTTRSISIDGVIKEVPPKTAEFLKRLLEE